MKLRTNTAIFQVVLTLTVALVGILTRHNAAAGAIETPAGAPPSDAVVVFDGHNTDGLLARDGRPCRWPIQDGALVAQPDGGLWTKLRFRDAQVHVEFATPRKGPGNSGLYFHGLWEMQIFNSYGSKSVNEHSAGAIYGIAAPLVNAARPPEMWQTYDIVFRSPLRDDNGKIIHPGSLTALLNGVLVQDQTPFREHVSIYTPLMTDKSPYVQGLRADLMKHGTAPLHLQDHGAPVRFRNLWIRHLAPKN